MKTGNKNKLIYNVIMGVIGVGAFVLYLNDAITFLWAIVLVLAFGVLLNWVLLDPELPKHTEQQQNLATGTANTVTKKVITKTIINGVETITETITEEEQQPEVIKKGVHIGWWIFWFLVFFPALVIVAVVHFNKLR